MKANRYRLVFFLLKDIQYMMQETDEFKNDIMYLYSEENTSLIWRFQHENELNFSVSLKCSNFVYYIILISA